MRVVSGIEVTTVTTTAQFPVGGTFSVSQATADAPAQVWTYVKAGIALAAGLVAMKASGSGTCSGVVLASNADAALGVCPRTRVVGVAQHTIALNSYGFILSRGVGVIKAGDAGTDQLDDPLVVDNANGEVDLLATTEESGIIALGLAAGTGDEVNFAAFIDCL
tara:strand:- start:46 stop:537 length:492 start_codon:yes stop_codon:yes gene_type:complete